MKKQTLIPILLLAILGVVFPIIVQHRANTGHLEAFQPGASTVSRSIPLTKGVKNEL